MRLSLLVALLLATATACDGGFSDSPDSFACVDGATLTATAAGEAYTAECVEVNPTAASLTVRSYVNTGNTRDVPARSLQLVVESRSAGTYSVSGGTFLSYTASPVSGSVPTSTTLVASGSGQVVVAESTDARVRGTFSFTGREEVTPAGGTTTPGATVTVTGAFDVPL